MQECTYQVEQLSRRAAPAPVTLRRADYSDAFRVSGLEPIAAREWAYAVLEQAPAQTRATLTSGWRAIGLRPAPDDRDAVLEWAVEVDEPDRLVLARRSWVGMPGELVFRSVADGLLFSTLVHHGHPLIPPAWAMIVPSHVRIVRGLLTAGARRRMRAIA